jgi:hypothetical protein
MTAVFRFTARSASEEVLHNNRFGERVAAAALAGVSYCILIRNAKGGTR